MVIGAFVFTDTEYLHFAFVIIIIKTVVCKSLMKGDFIKLDKTSPLLLHSNQILSYSITYSFCRYCE